VDVLGRFEEAAEGRVDGLGAAEVGPQIGVDRDELAASEVGVVSASRAAAVLRRIDRWHLLERLGGGFEGLRGHLGRCVAHGSLPRGR